VFLVHEALDSAKIKSDICVLRDGEQATSYVDELDRDLTAACPEIVILDINLPRKKGSEVLQHIRNSVRCRNAVVIVVSTSDSFVDRQVVTKLGANAYFRKPSDYDAFLKLGDLVRDLVNRPSGPP